MKAPGEPLPRLRESSPRRWIRRWGLVTVVLLAVATSVVWMTTRPAMPTYAGRSAKSWLRGVSIGHGRGFWRGTSHQDAIEAFQKMGVPGNEFLVEALKRRSTINERRYHRFINRLPRVLGQRWPRAVDSDTLAISANLVLMNVRDQTPGQTFPQLVPLLVSDHPAIRYRAADLIRHYTLHYPGLDVARFRPELVNALLGDTNDWVRIFVATALERARLGGPESMPALQRSLTNSDPAMRLSAEAVLRIRGANASAQ